jgi:hypothetical protein
MAFKNKVSPKFLCTFLKSSSLTSAISKISIAKLSIKSEAF